uniref:Uncharacterized protein n=1 Tax=Setaria italica TaxID=4555 RepID=K3Y0V1_SETIT
MYAVLAGVICFVYRHEVAMLAETRTSGDKVCKKYMITRKLISKIGIL